MDNDAVSRSMRALSAPSYAPDALHPLRKTVLRSEK